jgi:hypothetical protein
MYEIEITIGKIAQTIKDGFFYKKKYLELLI